jgi:thioredoxin 1
MADLLTVTSANFDAEVTQSQQPVLLDFWAEWCGPCRMVAPVVEGIAASYAGRLKVGKVNVDDEPELAARFGIRGIPSLLLFKGGQVAQMVVGFRTKEQLSELLDAELAG